MSDDVLQQLIDGAEDRISTAMAQLRLSGEINLSDLIVYLEEICQMAVRDRRKDVMPRLARLITELTEIEDELRRAAAELDGPAGEISHRRAADAYDSMSPPKLRP